MTLVTTSDSHSSHLASEGFDLTNFDVVSHSAHEEADAAQIGSHRWPSWVDEGLGLFVKDVEKPGDTFIPACAQRDVLCFGVLAAAPQQGNCAPDDETVSVHDSGLALSYQEAGSRLAMANRTERSFRSICVAVAPSQLARMLGVDAADLPGDVQRVLAGRRTALRSYRPSFRVQRIADEILAHRNASRALSSLYLKGKSYELLYTILDVLGERQQSGDRELLTARDIESVRRIHTLLERQIGSDETVDELARIAGMNRTKLRYAFKHLYGVTISEYRTTRRMRKADELLRGTDTPVAVIAYEIGYNGPSSFSVAYKKFFGHCANEARAR
jgi:AraC-like DNA-binding protein